MVIFPPLLRAGPQLPEWSYPASRLHTTGDMSMRRCMSITLAALLATLGACGDGTPTAPTPTALDLTGTWTGASTYPNAPFQLKLTQTGTTLSGEYTDQHDRSTSVGGTYTIPTMSLLVNFGDGGLIITGTVSDARLAQGTMSTPSLGNKPFPFTMTR